ncbi:multiple epidermal growth factor-like domains protein 10 [Patella vulgata]|uniref:multiple epidermal growth factor-like domains protein 10 n=1 Tax=Patella vulgata TaxID=6465 RepID=UPI00217FEC5B|nr:multiple epidermal growth factor-like domains protein 10 [Patella vulgata]
MFGDDCNKPCPVNCLDTCTRDDGKCNRCKPNTVGLYCNSTCGAECLPIIGGTQETCDRDGSCTECIVGRYGDGCDKICSTTCKDGCDRTNGRCNSCVDGKSGHICDKNCNSNCTVCNQDDIDICTRCKDGRWVISCNKQCSSNCNGQCDKSDGTCSICKHGWHGNVCQQQCSTNCNDGCDRITGKCRECKLGFIGDNCNVACSVCQNLCKAGNLTCDGCHLGSGQITVKNKDDDMGPVAGGVIGAIFGIVITAIISVTVHCYIIKRNQSSKPVSETRGYRYNNRPTIHTPTTGGDNSTSDDITYDTLQEGSTQQNEEHQYQTLNPDPAYVNLGLQ